MWLVYLTQFTVVWMWHKLNVLPILRVYTISTIYARSINYLCTEYKCRYSPLGSLSEAQPRVTIVLILKYRYYILVSTHQPDKGGGGHHHTHCTHNQTNSPAMESLLLWLGAAQGPACSCPRCKYSYQTWISDRLALPFTTLNSYIICKARQNSFLRTGRSSYGLPTWGV